MQTSIPNPETEAETKWYHSFLGALRRNPVALVLILWLLGWVLFLIFGAPLPFLKRTTTTAPKPAIVKKEVPEHRMSEIARRGMAYPPDNGSRFAVRLNKAEGDIRGLDDRVSALERWRQGRGKEKARTPPKRAALPRPSPPLTRPKPVVPPVPKETGGFTLKQNLDWKPDWRRMTGG
jgi:hypothetical protein